MLVENFLNEPWLDYNDAVQKGVFNNPWFNLGQQRVQIHARMFAEAPEDSQCHDYFHKTWQSMLMEDGHKFISFRPVNPHVYKYLEEVKVYEPRPFELKWIKHDENI
jgi:hypothetical protein